MLVKQIAAGSLARHRTYVYRWLLRFVSNETLAEDLLSEVFLDVWRQASRFQCRSSVSTWLMSIARHKALSARRRRTDAELDEKIAATVADPADNPETALQEKNRDELLRRALTRLSREHREVIDLVYYHDKSVDEVAQILGMPPGTVKTRMFYARKKLAALVDRDEESPLLRVDFRVNEIAGSSHSGECRLSAGGQHPVVLAYPPESLFGRSTN